MHVSPVCAFLERVTLELAKPYTPYSRALRIAACHGEIWVNVTSCLPSALNCRGL
jgi:hypothetical protein